MPDEFPSTLDRAAQLQARLTGILDASLDCIITIDSAGRVTDFNTAAEQTFGYQRAEALGREMAELIVPPALRERHRAGLRRLVETGQGAGMVGRRIEVTAMRANGSELPVELTITRIDSGGEAFFVAYLRADTTARLQTRFTGILDAALDCIITIDHTGRITDFNSAAERTFGFSRAEALGCEMAQLIVPPALREKHRLGLRRLVQTGQGAGLIGKRIEVPALRADGVEIPIELAITQIGTGGEHPFYTAYLRDISERKRTEATLAANAAQQREARDYFEKSFSASPALMSIARAGDGRIIAANSAFLRGSGFTIEEVLEHTTEELGLWTSLEARAEFLQRIRSAGDVRDFEADFRGKAGGSRTLLLNADIIELGGVACIFTVGVDVTERRRRDLIQAATYQISHAGLGGDDVPALCAKVHGIIGRLMSAKNFYVALINADRTMLTFPYFVDETEPHPAPRPTRNSFTELVLDTCEPVLGSCAEIVARLKERGPYEHVPGRVSCAQWMGAPLIVEGKSIGVIAVQDYRNPAAYGEEDKRLLSFVADQTAAVVHRREADAARSHAEQQYRSIFENTIEGLYQSTTDGRFIQANPALVRMLGYPSTEELLRAHWQNIYVKGGRREDFFELIQHSDDITDFESEVYRYDGSRIWISESVRVMRNAAGEIDHFEAVAVNVTAQREAARLLQHAKEEADAASRAKSTFLASMSHELRTPLNGILGYTQILRRDDQLTPRQREAIGVIQSSADHLLALINDVLDLSKIEARKLELHPTQFDLSDFTQAVVHVFVPRAREKNLQLETVYPPDLPRVVRGDEQRLRQVVFNLLGNAIKFTSQGGVVFSIERAADSLIRVSVSDSGPGISTEDQLRLFEPFTQVGDQRQRSGGTGLGLAISRSIVEQMGGRLELESQPGLGSRFWFELPLPAVESALTASPASAQITGYEGPRRRVLVADDHPANRNVLVDLLTPLGFEVTTANDGIDAIAAATHPGQQPDLVLLDLRMPRADGLTAARAIHEAFAARGEQGPIIVGVSASAFNVDRQTFLAGGCADFLAKPYREEQLLGLLGHHLGLTWIHAGSPAGETQFFTRAAATSAGKHPAPPSADLEELFRLASNGDVLGVRLLAEDLPSRDPNLAPFAHEIVDLAARYKMKAIRQFLSRYRS